MHSNRSVFIALSLVTAFAAGCGGGGATTTTTTETQTSSGASASPAPATAPGAPLAITPLTIRGTAENMAGHAIVLRADGTIAADEHVLGRIDGTRVLNPEGTVVFEVMPNGHLAAPGHGEGPELTADGALVAPDGRIVVNADGTIEERRPNGEVRPAPFRFETMPPDARRTAVVVVALITMVSGEPQAGPAHEVSVGPAAEAPSSAPPPASSAPPAGRRRRAH